MPRGGHNHAKGGKIAQGGNFRARRIVYFFPPLANFSCTPLLSVTDDDVIVSVDMCVG